MTALLKALVNKDKPRSKMKRLKLKVTKLTKRVDVLEDQLAKFGNELYRLKGEAYSDEKQKSFSAQEIYWANNRGVSYIFNNYHKDLPERVNYWTYILNKMPTAASFLELGCNIGSNLIAINRVKPGVNLTGVEINHVSAKEAQMALPDAKIITGSILEFESKQKWDCVFTRGVLIHIPSELLAKVYEKINRLATKFVVIYENYSPEPYKSPTYGHAGPSAMNDGNTYMFWRDFAGEFVKTCPDWEIVDETSFPPPKKGEKLKTQGNLVCTILKKVK